jgi:CheY-like chemotaxis protein
MHIEEVVIEVIKMLDSNQDIDMVLMDIMMTEMDGQEATKQIRNRDIYKDLPQSLG